MQLKKKLLVFAVMCVAVMVGHVGNSFAAAGDDSVYEWGPWGRQVTPAAGLPVIPAVEPATLSYRPGDNKKVTPTPIPPPEPAGITGPGPGEPTGGGTDLSGAGGERPPT